jgi:hypothetical protein
MAAVSAVYWGDKTLKGSSAGRVGRFDARIYQLNNKNITGVFRVISYFLGKLEESYQRPAFSQIRAEIILERDGVIKRIKDLANQARGVLAPTGKAGERNTEAELKWCNFATEMMVRSLSEQGDTISFNPAQPQDLERKMTPSIFHYTYLKYGMRCSGEEIQFTEEDLQAFGVKKEDVTNRPTQLQCIAYAFLQTRELRAKSMIFHGEELLAALPGLLKKWGYQPIVQPSEGDLVVYLKERKPIHMGYMLPSGEVRSKLGTMNPFAYNHPIGTLPDLFGDEVVFFRKAVE